ncbi:hypothetical protein [Dongia sp.]|uniref:hypothetical protein n=1 Tax=Dongia sp. TaxID=1977262 RepID=UPI0035B3B406
MSASTQLTPAMRDVFGQIADLLIPAYKHLPAATTVGVHRALLDDVLTFRPDIVEAFFRGLATIGADTLSADLNNLYRSDPEAFGAISLAASGGYYMSPEVRTALGYPGQESLTYNPHAVPDYLVDHLLERVSLRGPVYRPTPGE